MKRLLCAVLALCLAAGSADARGLVIRSRGNSANPEISNNRLMEVTLSMLNTLGADYRAVNIENAPQGATDALRRGTWFTGGSVNSDSAHYDPIIIVGDDQYDYVGTTGNNVGRASSVSGYALLHSALLEFAYWKPGFVVTGTGITGSAVVVSVDSAGGVARVAGTVAGGANIQATWRVPLRPDSLTFTAKYPKVTIIRIGNNFASGAQWTTGTSSTVGCSTGVGNQMTYSAAAGHDSIWNAYEIGNVYRSWKSRVRFIANTGRDPRGWRPLMGSLTTRQNTVGYAGGNFDFPDPVCGQCAYSTNPDTIGPVWAVMNWGADGTPIGGNAKPNVYCQVAGTFVSLVEPASLLTALAWGDSLSGGGLLGSSTTLPRKFGIHIDDAWRRGDSKFNTAYGMISTDDTTAYKGSIDSLASLQVPLVVSYEPESLATVLLADGVTGNGRYYDQRWWARNPYAHYTPHCHAGVPNGVTRAQNIFGEVGAGFTGKNIRVLDIFGLTRLRYAFGSVDSMLAYGLPDYVNDPADTGSVYWMYKRALALGDSVFGRAKVDRLLMPAGDDWTVTGTRHTRYRQHGMGVDSVAAALAALGVVGTRTNNINVVGNDDSTVTNNYGYYPTYRRIVLPQYGSGGDHPAGMPTWMPTSVYGRSFEVLPTNGYPSGDQTSGLAGSFSTWSHNRNSFGGDEFLSGLLLGKKFVVGDPGVQKFIYILTSHTGDYGSSGRTGEETRPQFYTTKYVMNQIRVANAHARRELVRCVYPQEVQP